MTSLLGRSALVTGAASGIGRAIALLFSQEGATLTLMDLDAAGVTAVVREIAAAGGQAIAVVGDVSQEANCRRAVEEAHKAWGRLDILVNNAGIIRRATVVETTPEEWDRVMAVNVRSAFLLSKYAIPLMEQAGGGAIIHIASGWGLVGGRRAAAYCASKGAMVLLTKAMALDHGPQNIRVNCICPGDTDTPMLRDEAEQLGADLACFLAEAADRPLRRLGRPEDIAQAALYLASDASSFVTGSVLVVDGGGLAGR